MSADLQLSSASDAVDFPYRAMSSSAIASLGLAMFALMAGFFFWPALVLAVLGVLLGLYAYRKIRRYPDEFDGKGVAMAGILFNVAILLGGIGFHAYVYLTEVPEGYSRVQFYELQQPGETPYDQPTPRAFEIDGDPVFIKGYIHPSSGSGMLKHFILVPDLGTCCFGGQPKSSDMIEVTLQGGQTTKAGLTKKKLAGTFRLNRSPHKVTDFENAVFYRMSVDQLR